MKIVNCLVYVVLMTSFPGHVYAVAITFAEGDAIPEDYIPIEIRNSIVLAGFKSGIVSEAHNVFLYRDDKDRLAVFLRDLSKRCDAPLLFSISFEKPEFLISLFEDPVKYDWMLTWAYHEDSQGKMQLSVTIVWVYTSLDDLKSLSVPLRFHMYTQTPVDHYVTLHEDQRVERNTASTKPAE